ncbi:hypothetical protein CR513_56137, partial [Mucuna pruriens]
MGVHNQVKTRWINSKAQARLIAKGFLQRAYLDYKDLDVKLAFLNGPLEEEVYVIQGLGFVVKGSEDKLGFAKCVMEHEVYVRGISSGDMFPIYFYVDDLLVIGNNSKEIDIFKNDG